MEKDVSFESHENTIVEFFFCLFELIVMQKYLCVTLSLTALEVKQLWRLPLPRNPEMWKRSWNHVNMHVKFQLLHNCNYWNDQGRAESSSRTGAQIYNWGNVKIYIYIGQTFGYITIGHQASIYLITFLLWLI